MVAGWRTRTLLELLTAHGLELSPEHDFPTDGWSGATFSSLTDPDGRRYVLKRTSLARDWIARATDDLELREAWLAGGPPGSSDWLSPGLLTYHGAAADGDGAAILMPDLSNELIAWERPGYDPVVDTATLGRVVRAIARLHALPWSQAIGSSAERDGSGIPPWCPLEARLTLLTARSARAYADEGNPVGERFLEGWAAFDGLASPAARDLISRLTDDADPLVTALGRLPAVGLHGDLKLANIALLADDRVGLIDWQMTLRAPVAVELGWFLVANSASLPSTPLDVIAGYREALEWDSGRWGSGSDANDVAGLAGDWEAQVDLSWIVGLLLRGWRKGIDAAAGAVLGSGVSAVDDLAWWCRRAMEAADRRL